MERKFNLVNIYKDIIERTFQKTPCPLPWINGTKPTELLRVAEQCKKHIRRDGKK